MTKPIEKPLPADEIISFDPATGEEVGRVRKFTSEEVAEAVEHARDAFEIWKRTPFDERARIVMRARQAILSQMDSIANLISREMGKPVAEAFSTDIVPVLDLMQYFARNTEDLLAPRKRGIGYLGLMGRSSVITYKPLGVVGIISPWNFPLTIPLGEAVMALMAGNTVVLKPSELTPLTGEKISEVFEAAGLPKHVLQVVSGDGETGAALVSAGVDKMMFTGSVKTGKAIAKSAAETLTPVVLELGGKDPMVVFADADLEKAADAAVWGAFTNAGQACSSVERLYVEHKAAERFTRLVVERAQKLRVGKGTEPDSDIGAISSETQRKIVEEHVSAFEREGAEILTGGNDSDVKSPFYPPTVISKAKNKMRAMRDETFGPTLPIATFKTESEAAELANDTEFGLAASVWTSDLAKGKRVAGKILAGTVCVNEVLYTHGIAQTPWGGFKNSGYGRTHGLEGLKELVGVQHIHVNRFTFLPDVWWFRYSKNAVDTFREMARKYASGSLFDLVRFLPSMWSRIRDIRRQGSEDN
ncbi:MAG: aldehyde dehydrogenase family protein [Acidobacteria bacterium]|nr:MAG: aldehyde dehydrogenase family protein [Acidobacteriota bacterium]REJ99161.1 MAG: aldehyde dehydrogenase family protein [Acidobacteriota bacterium]REK16118.1 MAG: aldehyde dehydrogenase family protein [Acidobacteriota bacterium]REK43799.1 MAG: aldehyde dehydrogenase family protein [Acidobacteriota bacterium]